MQRTSVAGQLLEREPIHTYEFQRLSPVKIRLGSLTADIDARRLTGGTVPSRAAGISALSSMASSSVTLCATEQGDTLKFVAVTRIISPFTVSELQSHQNRLSALAPLQNVPNIEKKPRQKGRTMTSFRGAMAKLGAGVDNELGGSAPHQCR